MHIFSSIDAMRVDYYAEGDSHEREVFIMAEWGLNRGESSPVRGTFQRLQANRAPRITDATATEIAAATAQGATTSDDIHRMIASQRDQ